MAEASAIPRLTSNSESAVTQQSEIIAAILGPTVPVQFLRQDFRPFTPGKQPVLVQMHGHGKGFCCPWLRENGITLG